MNKINSFTEAGYSYRLSKILDPKSGNGIVVAIDHGLFIGPLPGVENTERTIQALLPTPPEAIQMTPGTIRANLHLFQGKGKPGIILRLDATNIWRKEPAPKEGYYSQVACVNDAIQLGVDAVVTFLFLGYDTDAQESHNLETIARIGEQARKHSIPFIVEPLAIQKGSNVVRNFDVMKLAIRMASELGADLIKADYPENKEQFAQLVDLSSVPIMVRGGPKMDSDEEMLQMVRDAIDLGAKGIVFGRNVWQHESPSGILKALRAIVHEGKSVSDSLKLISTGKA